MSSDFEYWEEQRTSTMRAGPFPSTLKSQWAAVWGMGGLPEVVFLESRREILDSDFIETFLPQIRGALK